MTLRVYIAGPYTKGDVARNVKNAIRVGEYVANQGCTPFIPHLTHFWHMFFEHPYGHWLEYDLEWLKQCHIVVRLAGESAGADREVEYAAALGMPVFHLKGFAIDELNRLDEFLRTMKRELEEALPL